MTRVRLTMLAVAALLVAALSGAQEGVGFVVIVHPDNPATSVSAEELSKYFLKTVESWPDGVPVAPVDLTAGSPVRDAFCRAVHDRTAEAVTSYWQKQIFSGRGVPPVEVGSSAEAVTFVRQNRGGVGYVASGTDLAGAKAVNLKFLVGGVSTPPERIKYVPPRYPEIARRAGIAGVVVLELFIDEKGDVTDVKVVNSLSHGITDEAIRAAKQWKFRPATRDGRPVATSIQVSLQFNPS